MSSRDTHHSPPPRSRLSFFLPTAPPIMTTDPPADGPGSPRIRSILRTTSVRDPSSDHTDKSYRLSLRKARKLSRVFTEFSLLDPFAARKSVDDLRAPQSTPRPTQPRPSTAHAHTHAHKISLDPRSKKSFDGRLSRPTSPTSPSAPQATKVDTTHVTTNPNSETANEKMPQSPLAPPTPHIKSLPLPETIPLPPSRPGSSRGGSILIKKRRKSLDLRQLDESRSRSQLSTRSNSLRISDMSRPTTPKSPRPWPDLSPDAREPPASPEAAHNHYLEVKRARKMTQLFGQELPPELIRVLDDRRKTECTRHRTDSTASSSLDSAPPTPIVEEHSNPLEEENVTPPKMPDVEFQERRRRVAKLSHFFGVNHTEIASSMVFTKPSDHRPTSLDVVESGKSAPVSGGEPIEVGVKLVSRRRWGLGEDMRDVELSDAITKLRCLKAN